MTIKTLPLLSLFCMIISTFTVSKAYGKCDGMSCSGVLVERLYIETNDRVYIGTSGDENQLTCAMNDNIKNNIYLYLERDKPYFGAVFSLILTAHTKQQTLWFKIESGDVCNIRYVVSDLVKSENTNMLFEEQIEQKNHR